MQLQIGELLETLDQIRESLEILILVEAVATFQG